MGYFSNPNFMYIQDYPYSSKEIDNFIVRAYKNGKVKVVHGNQKYVVKKEIERIKKYRNIRLRKPIPSKNKQNNKAKSNSKPKSKRNSKKKISKGRYFKN